VFFSEYTVENTVKHHLHCSKN